MEKAVELPHWERIVVLPKGVNARAKLLYFREKCRFMPNNIPIAKAVELCREHRDKHKVRLFSQCWGCLKYSKEEPSKMCFYNENNPTENRGCKFVNKLFDESK